MKHRDTPESSDIEGEKEATEGPHFTLKITQVFRYSGREYHETKCRSEIDQCTTKPKKSTRLGCWQGNGEKKIQKKSKSERYTKLRESTAFVLSHRTGGSHTQLAVVAYREGQLYYI